MIKVYMDLLLPQELPNPTIELPYSESVAVTNVNPEAASPVVYRLTSGLLPSGLTLDSATGVISGTPNAVGTFTFTIEAIDQYGNVGSKRYTEVLVGTMIVGPLVLATGKVGQYYSVQLTATNGSVNPLNDVYCVTAGALPPGISISERGLISGVPTNYGDYKFTITVRDDSGNTGSHAYN